MTVTSQELTTVAVKAIVDQAVRLGLVWSLRPAKVVGTVPTGQRMVLMDGDVNPISVYNLIGSAATDSRVMCMIVPPSGVYIIGTIDTQTNVNAGLGLIESPINTLHVGNTDGYLSITADSVDIDPSLLALITGSGQKFLDTTVGDGVSTTIDIVHGISGGVTFIYGPTLMDNATGDIVVPDYQVLSSTTVRLMFGAAPSLNAYSFGFTY